MMGKWRTRYSRAPSGALDDVTPTGELSVESSLLSGAKNGSIIDGDSKIKNEEIFWEKQLEDVEGREVLAALNAQDQTILTDPLVNCVDGKINNGAVVVHNKLDGGGNGVRKENGFGDEKCDTVSVNAMNRVDASVDEEHEGIDEEDFRCGLGPCTPQWMQIFASKQAFLVTFCITWVLQGMYYTYFVSVITTIEKLFQIQSKTTGIIMSATEIGQIGSSLLLTYYGGQGHRPKWIAWGMVLFAVSSFTCSLPHFLFGEDLIKANDLLFGGVSSTAGSVYAVGNDSEPLKPNICYPPMLNESWTPFNESRRQDCKEEYLEEKRIQSKHTTIVLAIFFISLLGVGMGQTAVYTLGIPYIDDNVASRESPLYFGKSSFFKCENTLADAELVPSPSPLSLYCTNYTRNN